MDVEHILLTSVKLLNVKAKDARAMGYITSPATPGRIESCRPNEVSDT